MISLTRPNEGRLIVGVCRAMEGAYGVPVLLIRAIVIAGFLVAPVMLVLYLLLGLSIPSERNIASELRLRESELGTSGFTRLTSLLLDRMGARQGTRGTQYKTVVPLLFLATLAFGLPHVEGTAFHQLYPLIDPVVDVAGRLASIVLYLLIAAAFLIYRPRKKSAVVLRLGVWDRLELDTGGTRSIGGLASGIANVTRIDVAWVRVFLIVLNLLTLGFVGVVYFLAVWLLRKTGRSQREHSVPATSAAPKEEPGRHDRFALVASALFGIIAIVRLSTDLGLFFFNEQFIRGIMLGVLGVLVTRRRGDVWLLIGVVLFLLGVFDLCAAIYHVQPGVAGKWEAAYLIAALSIFYYAVVALHAKSLRVALGLAGAAVVAMIFVGAHITSEPFLLALAQFYDFFYPLLFAGLGLWVGMEG